MVIMHNLEAMNANRMFGITNGKLASATEKLSSGYRINRSADDAAGLSISEKMRRQIRGLAQASVNAQDGISMVQIADGAMSEVMEMLQRGNELSVKAANGTYTDIERGYIQDEINHIKEEIDGISDRTKFNGFHVLKGKDVPVDTSVGGAAVISGLPSWVTLGSNGGTLGEVWETEEAYITDTTSHSDTAKITHAAATLNFSAFDGSATKVNELIGQGFYSTCCTCSNHYSIRFTSGQGNSVEQSGQHYIYNIGIDGADSGDDLVKLIIQGTGERPQGHYSKFVVDPKDANKLVIYDDRANTAGIKDFKDPTTGETVKWQNWPNATYSNNPIEPHGSYGSFGKGIAVSSTDVPSASPVNVILQIGGEKGETMNIDLPSISTSSVKIKNVDVSTVDSAGAAINSFRDAIDYVSKERARMGSYQNRLEHTIASLDNVVENTQAAESRIRDTDMADTMVENSNLNILAQAGQSMLAQANKSKEGILALLG